MYRETIKDVENFKSEEFKGLKEREISCRGIGLKNIEKIKEK